MSERHQLESTPLHVDVGVARRDAVSEGKQLRIGRGSYPNVAI